MDKISKTVIVVLIWVFGFLGFASLSVVFFLLFEAGWLSAGRELDLENADHIGGLIGGFVGVFWTVMGVLLLVRTLHIQKEEFKETQKAILNQQFESGYFQMLSQLQLIRESIKGPSQQLDSTGSLVGAQYLHFACSRLLQRYENEVFKGNGVNYDEIEQGSNFPNPKFGASTFAEYRAFVCKVYDDFYDEFHPYLGHYFRYLQNIINYTVAARMKYWKDEEASDVEMYLNLLQAQLSNDELVLLLYFSLSTKSYDSKELPLLFNVMERINFFHNVEETGLLRRGHHHFFPQTTFRFLSIDERAVKNSNR